MGRSFGAFVTHKIKTYIYFSVSTAARMSVRVLSPQRWWRARTYFALLLAGCSKCIDSAMEGYIMPFDEARVFRSVWRTLNWNYVVRHQHWHLYRQHEGALEFATGRQHWPLSGDT